MAKSRFPQFAWGLLAYNLVVILGGAFVRATTSGDGCGGHWPTCNGQIIPHIGRIATVIEFSHRISTGLLLPLTLLLVAWAFRAFPKRHPVRSGALCALGFTFTEALIGAWLVLYHLVAHNESVPRAIAMPVHLVATLLLLMSVTLTAWWASGGRPFRLRGHGKLGWAFAMGFVAALILGVSGAITALGDTLFPARSLRDGLRQDFSPTANFLVHLRYLHPLIAMYVGLSLLLMVGMALEQRPSAQVRGLARLMGALFLVQLGAGLLNYLLMAPIWMQLAHLFLADLLWISVVLFAAAALAEPGAARILPEALAAGPPPARGPVTWKDYLALTKPRVISLLLFTAVTAMYIAAGSEHRPWPGAGLVLAVAVGFYMAAGAANAINMVLERDLDVQMARTAERPTASQKIAPRAALQFAAALMAGSFALLWREANLLSALMAMSGLAFYVLIYTVLLKRRTWSNIVIGGAAGAFPPLVGWAAVTGDLSPMAWYLFGIIFLWTPVHFWALAILIKDDYARAGVPMLPVVHGDRATVVQIAMYTVLTVALSAMPLMMRTPAGQSVAGAFYLGAATLLNAVLVLRSLQLYQHPDRPRARSLFKYSMVYLALLFLALAVDQAHWIARN